MSSHSIQVSGISSTTTETRLHDFFILCGKINSIRHQGFTADIHFEKSSAAKTALMLSGKSLDGAKLAVMPGYGPGAPGHQKDTKVRAGITSDFISKSYEPHKQRARGLSFTHQGRPVPAFDDDDSTDGDSESGSSTDDYGEAEPPRHSVASRAMNIKRAGAGTVVQTNDSESSSDATDDDVPLAQRIPTALRAQNTIRRQAREERERRKRVKAEKVYNQQASPRSQPFNSSGPSSFSAPPPSSYHHPPGAAPADPLRISAAGITSSQEAAMHASSASASASTRPQRRPTTTTRPAVMSQPEPNNQPFTVDDLTRKLMSVQATGAAPAVVSQDPRSPRMLAAPVKGGHMEDLGVLKPSPPLSSSYGRPLFDMPAQPSSASAATTTTTTTTTGVGARGLRHARSFHKPAQPSSSAIPREAVPDVPALPPARISAPATSGGASLSRNNTTSRQRSHSIKSAEGRPRPSGEAAAPLPRSAHHSARTSLDQPADGGSASVGAPGVSVPPVPPLPADVLASMGGSPNIPAKVQLTQQRVFIGDMQRANTVEVSSATTATDLLGLLDAQGAFDGWRGSGGWMVFEVVMEFGMERPIRSFELLTDVTSAWNKDKMVNAFLVKLSSLAAVLSRVNIPSVSPIYAGWVQYETKPGKWNKRWLSLRDHNLYLSKRENSKDETSICSLSNFDAYNVTRPYRAPKPYVFAAKSTDNITIFENAADYLHVFCCSENEGKVWLEKILLARSFYLCQDRSVATGLTPVIPNPASSTTASASTTAAIGGSKSLSRSNTVNKQSLSRAGTRKGPSSRNPAPLLDTTPTPVFEPGSLLAKHTA